MSLIDVIEVEYKGNVRKIELHQGDLTNLPADDAVDVLIVSAFPDHYFPTAGTVIGALDRRGISVASLATHKAVDLRQSFSCWMSQPLSSDNATLGFRSILCFEPLVRGKPPEVVGDIFRALAPFLGDDPPVRSAAMPIVAAGAQGYAIADMLTPLVSAAFKWMQIGLPIETLKIFTYSGVAADQARIAFAELKRSLQPVQRRVPYTHDVFVSYSRKNAAPGEEVGRLLQQAGLKVYIDVQSLEVGVAWQPHIFEALEHCAKVIALYTPEYLQSKICQEEFNIAWTRQREEETPIIFPIYWRTANLPIYMKMLNFVDCREEKRDQLRIACDKVVTAVRPSCP
jgi:hypothetical protein